MKNILSKINFYICTAVYNVIYFFTTKLFCRENVQSGKLTVTGSDKIEIELKHLPLYRPIKVAVKFDDNCAPHPCNPHHNNHDHLRWEIVKARSHHYGHTHHGKKNSYILIIHWQVESFRVIKWEVF